MIDVIFIVAAVITLIASFLLSRGIVPKQHRVLRWFGAGVMSLVTLGLIAGLGVRLWFFHRVQPSSVEQPLFQGVTYIREVQTGSHPLVIHVLKIDLTAQGVGFLVTPAQPSGGKELRAMPPSQFLKDYGVQAAINGNDFEPWESNIFYYYPRPGDPVNVIGFASSQGDVYSTDSPQRPTLYISADNKASFQKPSDPVYNAVSGLFIIVNNGKVVAPRRIDELHYGGDQPRTILGLDKDAHTLILIVIDGRQPNYSDGTTVEESAQLAIKYGATIAMNQDGGGSSAMVIQNDSGDPEVINSPIDSLIPGQERSVGNHLGVFALPLTP